MRSRMLPWLLAAGWLIACHGTPNRTGNKESAAPPASAVVPGNELKDEAAAVGFRADGQVAAEATATTGGESWYARSVSDPSGLSVMIVRTGQASIEVDSLDRAIGALRMLAGRLGGYLANTSYQGGRDQHPSASIEIKVPSNRFDDLLSGISPLGKLEYANVSAQDVGEEYADIAARVANGKRLEARLVELLAARTGKLADILEVERELARVREEIERYEGRMRYLASHASLSSLTVSVHQPLPIQGTYQSTTVLAEAARQAWVNFVELNARLIASLGVLLPMGLAAATVLALVRRWWRLRLRAA